MRQARALWMRLCSLWRGGRREDEFAAELESHVALHTEDGMRAGLSAEEARRQALIKLGGAEQARQAYRERGTLPWLEHLAQDARYGVRTMRRSPGFTLAAVLTLALGIGACTAIFSMVNAVLLRSLPYGDPGLLVYLYTPDPALHLPAEIFSPSNADFYDIQRLSHSFARMTFMGQSTFNLASQGSVERIGAARVDANFFATLRSYPELGRALAADDQQPGHNRVAVIGDALWQSMFAASSAVLKDSLSLDGAEYRIVGVMPPEFGYPRDTELPYGNAQIKTTQVWIPLALSPQQMANREGSTADAAIARLRPGVTVQQAQAELGTIMQQLDKLHDPRMRGFGALVKSFPGTIIAPVRPLMGMLAGAVLLVLLIACANTASLLLARASDRLRELGVRSALGAGRSRIARQLLTESLLIGLGGGAIGVGLAYAFLRVLPWLNPGNIPRLGEARLDARVLLFTVAVSVGTSLLSGIVPMLTLARLDLTAVLNGSSRTAAGRHSRLQSALIVAEASMVVVLMVCAGLLIRSYVNVESIQTGFSRSTVSMKISLGQQPGAPAQRAVFRRAFFHSLIGKLRALPGVTGVGAISDLPLSGSESLSMVWVQGDAHMKDQFAEGRGVTPGYFSAMGIPLLAGRLFSEEDDSSGARAAIVNQRFVRLYLAHRDPIGARISMSGDASHWETVVGVVGDVRHASLEETPMPQIYNPNYEFDSAYIAVGAALPAATIASEARAVTKTIDPNVAVADVHTMGELESQASARRRFQTTLLTLFAGIALLLALAGIYGLMSYSVSRREREVGIRMALGAQRSGVMLLVLRNAAALLGLGLAIGVGCAWFATRAVNAFLFQVGDHDPITLLLVCLLLAVCGLIAAFVPARRAASVDPMQALRAE